MAWVFSLSSTTVNEGGSITITLNTSNDPVPNGTKIPFRLFPGDFTKNPNSLGSDDFVPSITLPLVEGQNHGEFLISGNVGKVTFTIREDLKSEGDEKVSLLITEGPHYGEGIGFTIKDTSKTPPSVVGQLSITADKYVINEGNEVTFNIKGLNLQSGTAVPYQIFGITSDDLLNPSSIQGVATLLTSNALIGETQANVTVVTKDDKVTEGSESIVLLIFPDFSYTLELNATVAVVDTSIDNRPRITITSDVEEVLEGNNVKFTINTTNLEDGTEIEFYITPWDGDVNLADFTGYYKGDDLTTLYTFKGALSGTLPKLRSDTEGNANITLVTRDDYVFEPTEKFIFSLPAYNVSSRVITLIDSGNKLIQTKLTYTGNVILNFLDKANLQPVLGSLASDPPFWKDTTGLLSENMVLEGKLPFAEETDLVYYQPFSYVINSAISVAEWGETIKSVLHPAGMAIFGEINNETIPSKVPRITVSSVSEAEIKIIDVISTDDTTIDSSDTTVTVVYPEVKTIPLTADAQGILGGI